MRDQPVPSNGLQGLGDRGNPSRFPNPKKNEDIRPLPDKATISSDDPNHLGCLFLGVLHRSDQVCADPAPPIPTAYGKNHDHIFWP